MRVIPVLDLLHGQVVHGRAGKRDRYQPILSTVCPSARPCDVARAFVSLGLDLAYAADLDAILGGPPQWAQLDAILETGIALWIDPGLRHLEDARAWAEFATSRPAVHGVIAASETLAGADVLTGMHAILGDRLVFSLDLVEGEPRCAAPAWRSQSPMAIAMQALEAGPRTCIVLDLAGVGMGRGPRRLDLCRTIHAQFPHVRLVTGGGVRGPEDLEAIADAGCWGALVASALHDGRLTATDLARVRAPGGR